jgi:hypothetical protein
VKVTGEVSANTAHVLELIEWRGALIGAVRVFFSISMADN